MSPTDGSTPGSKQPKDELLVEECLLLELKCAQEILPIHKAQLLSYMKRLDVLIGLLINFHELKLAAGISRRMLPGSNQ